MINQSPFWCGVKYKTYLQALILSENLNDILAQLGGLSHI